MQNFSNLHSGGIKTLAGSLSKLKGAYLFDGLNDKIVVSNEPDFDLTSGFTLEVELLVTGADTYNGIISKFPVNGTPSSGWDLVLQNGIPRMTLRGSNNRDTGVGWSGAADLRDGNWHTIKMVNTPSLTTIFIDGEQKATNGATWTPVANDVNCEIGYRQYTSNFEGKMRYIRVLDENNSPILIYTCDEGAGTTARDRSGNGNSGVLTSITEATFHSTI